MARNRKTDRTPQWDRLVALVTSSRHWVHINGLQPPYTPWDVACYLNSETGEELINAAFQESQWPRLQRRYDQIFSQETIWTMLRQAYPDRFRK